MAFIISDVWAFIESRLFSHIRYLTQWEGIYQSVSKILFIPSAIFFAFSCFTKWILSNQYQSFFDIVCCCCFLSHVWFLWRHELQHARFPCPLPFPGACSNSCPLTHWCHQTISSSVTTFSSCLQSFSSSESFPISQLFASGGQSIGASASASVLLMNIQDWFPLGCTGLISPLSKGLPRIFSSTTIRKHQFFGIQSSLCSNTQISIRLLEKP